MPNEIPAPELKRFERVLVIGRQRHGEQYHGERGTVVWLDSHDVRREPARPDLWMYIVHLPARSCWRTFHQSDLESEGAFDQEAVHLGQRHEISFDILLNEENDFAEGSYRLPGEFWKVMIFRKEDVPEVHHEPSKWQKPTQWEQDITGVVFRVPRAARVSREYLLRAMSDAFGHSDWVEVSGPDSIVLR